MEAPLFISIMIFCALAFSTVGIFAYVAHAGQRRKLLSRIKTAGGVASEPDAPVASQNLSLKKHLQAVVSRLGDVAKPKSAEELGQINKKFLQAGFRGKNIVVVFFGAKVLCAGLLAVSFFPFQLLITRPMTTAGLMLIFLVFVAAGFYLPNLWLNLKVSGRREGLTLGLPDALDLLVVCVEAGMGLDAAIKRVGEEMKLSSKAISEEFGVLNLELRAGKSRRDALKNLALRTGLDDVNALATLLVQAQKFGANVGQALRVHADSMRAKRSQRAEELAAKLPIKLLFPTICFIFPSLFLVLMGPALLQVYRIWLCR
jgi:tight adherence protein C